VSEPGPARCVVRPATSADAPVLLERAERYGLSASTRRSLERDLARAEVAHVAQAAHGPHAAQAAHVADVAEVAEVADTRAPVVLVALGDRAEVVGAALGLLQHDEGHVLDLGVDPAQRRHGIGTALLRALLDALLARGARAVTLEVRAGNLGAQALYRAEGFAVEGRRPGYYPDGEDAVIMWWRPATTSGDTTSGETTARAHQGTGTGG